MYEWGGGHGVLRIVYKAPQDIEAVCDADAAASWRVCVCLGILYIKEPDIFYTCFLRFFISYHLLIHLTKDTSKGQILLNILLNRTHFVFPHTLYP